MTIHKTSLKKAKSNFFNTSLLLLFVAGIFLYPNIAFLKTINKNNILELVNQERAKAGLTELRGNEQLDRAALSKAEAILVNQEFSHDINGEKFSYWIKAADYKYSYAGENLAIDFVSAEGAVKAWLESMTHKQNILNPRFTETGIAIKEGTFKGVNTVLVVQIFGTPLYSAPLNLNELDQFSTNYSKNNLNTLFSSRISQDANRFYLESSYLDSSLATNPALFAPSAPEMPTIKIKNPGNGPLFSQVPEDFEKFNMIFLLTLVLSLSMTLIYLLSNHLLKNKTAN